MLCLLVAAVYLFWDVARPLQVTDEFWYAEIVRGMRESGDLITPRLGPTPELKKPPLFFWLSLPFTSVAPLRVAIRIIPGLCFLALLALVYRIARTSISQSAARLATGVLLLSYDPLQMHGFRAGVMAGPVVLETALVFWACLGLRRQPNRLRWIGALLGLTFLTKSAFVAIPLGITVSALWLLRGKKRFSLGLIVQSLALAVAVPAPWLIAALLTHGMHLIDVLIVDQALRRALADPTIANATARIWGRETPLYALRHYLTYGQPWPLLTGAAIVRLIRAPAQEQRPAEFMLRLAAAWFLGVFVIFLLSRAAWPWYISSVYVPGALLCGWLLSRFLDEAPAPAPAVFALALVAPLVLPTVLTYDPNLGQPGIAPLRLDFLPQFSVAALLLILIQQRRDAGPPRRLLLAGAVLALLYCPYAWSQWGNNEPLAVALIPVLLASGVLAWASRATPASARRACAVAIFVVAAGYLAAPLRFANDRLRPEIARARVLADQGVYSYSSRLIFEYVIVYHALSKDYEVSYDESQRRLTVRPRPPGTGSPGGR